MSWAINDHVLNKHYCVEGFGCINEKRVMNCNEPVCSFMFLAYSLKSFWNAFETTNFSLLPLFWRVLNVSPKYLDNSELKEKGIKLKYKNLERSNPFYEKKHK